MQINKPYIIEIIYGFTLFILAQPYFMWHFEKLTTPVIGLVLFGISLFYTKDYFRYKMYDFLLLLFMGFLYLYYIRDSAFFGFISMFPMVFFFLKRDKLLLFYNSFKFFFAISIFLSLIVYFLVVVFNINIDYQIIEPLNSFKPYSYNQYPFLVLPNGFDKDIFEKFRFSGMFDEAGVVGTFAAIILTSEKFNLKSKRNAVILIGGLVSLSLFFFIICVLFVFYYGNNKFRFFYLLIFFSFFLYTQDNPIIYSQVWERLEFENGKMKGNNRATERLDAYYSSFIKSDDFLFGKGAGYSEKYDNGGSASYKQIIINHGIIFTITLFLVFILYGAVVIKERRNIFIFTILFVLLIAQRPFIFDPIYFFLVVVSINLLIEKKENKALKN
jgi:hypothetical protein